MQLHGQMARVPVKARQKFSEVAYSYNGMFAHRTNSVVFPFYLSAFVSALRSVTYYLQKSDRPDENEPEGRKDGDAEVEPQDSAGISPRIAPGA